MAQCLTHNADLSTLALELTGAMGDDFARFMKILAKQADLERVAMCPKVWSARSYLRFACQSSKVRMLMKRAGPEWSGPPLFFSIS